MVGGNRPRFSEPGFNLIGAAVDANEPGLRELRDGVVRLSFRDVGRAVRVEADGPREAILSASRPPQRLPLSKAAWSAGAEAAR